MRGACARHERGVGCGGRIRRARRTRLVRTVKSRGSGAAVLAPSLRKEAQATEAKEPFSAKSAKQAVKPLRREGRDAPPVPVCSCAAFALAQTARGTAGAGSTRSSLRPLSWRATQRTKPRVKDAARSRRHACERRMRSGLADVSAGTRRARAEGAIRNSAKSILNIVQSSATNM
jgi:hypothetical protein